MKIFPLLLNLTAIIFAIATQSFAQSNEAAGLINSIKEIFRQRYGREIEFTLAPGTSAVGEEIFRSSKTLTIDTTPCGPEPHAVVYFVKNWKEDSATAATCKDGKVHDQLQVVQK